MFDESRATYFPTELIPGITARPVADTGTFWSIIGGLTDKVFTSFRENGAYEMPDDRWEIIRPLRDSFAAAHHEWFIFYAAQDIPIGWSYGTARDSVTFFMAWTGILPDYQRRGIYTAFLKQFLSYLATLGYERVVSNHQTNNRAVVIAKLKAGFNVTAVNLDERWGAQVELTYLFHEDRRRGYERAFALEPRPLPAFHR